MKHKSQNTALKLQPLADPVLIREHVDTGEKKTSSGIIIPVGVDKDKDGKRGEVVAVGLGRIEDGKKISLSVKVGDTVMFQWGDKVSVEGKEYYIVKESEILAIIK